MTEPSEHEGLHIDSDWKTEAAQEKQRLAEQEQKETASKSAPGGEPSAGFGDWPGDQEGPPPEMSDEWSSSPDLAEFKPEESEGFADENDLGSFVAGNGGPGSNVAITINVEKVAVNERMISHVNAKITTNISGINVAPSLMPVSANALFSIETPVRWICKFG